MVPIKRKRNILLIERSSFFSKQLIYKKSTKLPNNLPNW